MAPGNMLPSLLKIWIKVMSIFSVRLNFVSGIVRKHLFLPLSFESTTSLLVYSKPSLFASPQIINICDHLMIVVTSFNSCVRVLLALCVDEY